MERATASFVWPRLSGAPERSQKVKYHLILITKSISKIFIPNFVCVFSQIKDTKRIRQDFHSVACAMHQEWDFGALWCPGGHFFKKTWSCGISNQQG